jgi:hypothetical protein
VDREELREAVVDNTSRDDKTSQINRLLYRGLQNIARRHPFRELCVDADVTITAAGDSSVSLPSSAVSVRSIVLENGTSSYELNLLSKFEFEQIHPMVSSEGNGYPTDAWLDYSTSLLHFASPANASYVLRVSHAKDPSDFASDSTESPLLHANEALIAWATMRLFQSLQMHEDASYWDGVFREELAIAINADYDKIKRRMHGFKEDPVLPPDEFIFRP